jgi:hypothetical protein
MSCVFRKDAAPFDVEKQKVEIPKLRVTLDDLLADGRLVRAPSWQLSSSPSRSHGR